VELGATIKEILATVDASVRPAWCSTPLSELRLLAGSPLRYRRQILALKQFFASRGCTALLLDDMTATDQDLQTQSIAHAVVRLEAINPDYGSERRRLRVMQYRGTTFRGGYHACVIGGAAFASSASRRRRTSARDAPPPAAQRRTCARRPARRRARGRHQHAHRRRGGNRQVDPGRPVRPRSGRARATGGARRLRREPGDADHAMHRLGIRLAAQIVAGRVSMQQVDPAELSQGEFIDPIREAVRTR
jgi:circadian clock protein KaiC